MSVPCVRFIVRSWIHTGREESAPGPSIICLYLGVWPEEASRGDQSVAVIPRHWGQKTSASNLERENTVCGFLYPGPCPFEVSSLGKFSEVRVVPERLANLDNQRDWGER